MEVHFRMLYAVNDIIREIKNDLRLFKFVFKIFPIGMNL